MGGIYDPRMRDAWDYIKMLALSALGLVVMAALIVVMTGFIAGCALIATLAHHSAKKDGLP